jgi:hypothetical protein
LKEGRVADAEADAPQTVENAAAASQVNSLTRLRSRIVTAVPKLKRER